MSSAGLEAAERHRQAEGRARTTACMRDHRDAWRVVQRLGNASAFSGYHWTPSAYSAVRCGDCGRVWRTKAAYVADLPDEAAS